MKIILPLVAILIGVLTNSYSQVEAIATKKNKVEVYVPICHFFDRTNTNWTLLVRGQKAVYDPGRVFLHNKEVMRIPATFAIQYTRSISPNNSLRLSILGYYMDYPDDSLNPGEVMRRSYGLFSLVYLHRILGNNKVQVDAFGEVNYRRGTELVHIYFPYPWDNRVESLMLRDMGLSIGTRIERVWPINILISGEVKYTRFLYRYSDGVDFFGKHKDSTPNTLTIKFGLGYQF